MVKGLVSIIITTKNEAAVIGRLLKSIKRQPYKKIETLVVDNNSTDKTVSIVEALGVKILKKGPERSAQRNFGFQKSKGEYVLFLDADMELSHLVIEECLMAVKRKKNIGAVVIPEESIATTFWEKVKAFERSFYNEHGDEITEAARFFPKAVLEKIGGYDEKITGPEDWELPERVKRKGYLVDRINSKIYHYERIKSLHSLIKKKFYYGKKAHVYLSKQKLPIISPKTIYFLRPVFYQQWRKTIRSPILTLAMFVMFFCELVGGGLGYIVGILDIDSKQKRILLLTTPFRPNIGGVETHLDDLINKGIQKGIEFEVLTYQPLITESKGQVIEKGEKFTVYRIPWIRMNLFLRLEKYPALEFFYLFPALFLAGLVLLCCKGRNISTIHSQGLIAGAAGVVLGKLFSKPVIVSTHSIYNFPRQGLYRRAVQYLFSNSKHVLTLSLQSQQEILDLKINANKISTFTYWVDQKRFRPQKKSQARKILQLSTRDFICLFVGRLVVVKGIRELLDSARTSSITYLIIGDGPLKNEIIDTSELSKNIVFVGRVDNDKLSVYYNAADVLVVPSVHEEGFGRVILESLSCGLPVIGSNRGGIKESMSKEVGVLIKVTAENISQALKKIKRDKKILKTMSRKALIYARNHFSDKNIDQIIKYYE